MSTLPVTSDIDDDHSGGLSPAALTVFVCPDMIGFWRLRKSIALDDARWHLKSGARADATQRVAAARCCHREIMRIVHFKRTGVRHPDSLRFAQNFRFDASFPAQVVATPKLEKPKPVAPQIVVAKPAAAQNGGHRLTPREYQVAQLVGLGLTNNGISKRLAITSKNAGVYVWVLRNKVGAPDRAALTSWAQKHVPGPQA